MQLCIIWATRNIAQFAPKLRNFTPITVKPEWLLVESCIIPQKKRNDRLLGGALRAFFSQGTGSANLAPICAKLRRIAPTFWKILYFEKSAS